MSVIDLVNQTEIGFDAQGKTVFGKLELYLVRVSHTNKSSISIPGVQGGQYKDKDENGNQLFKGLARRGPNLLMVQVLTKKNTQGEDYQVVKQYRSKEFSNAKVQRWEKFGFPPVHRLLGAQIDDYMGQTSDNIVYSGNPAWVKAEELPTGETFGEAESPITYWDFQTLYSKESDMRLAEEAFWDEVRSRSGDSEEDAPPDFPGEVELATPPTGGWTAETWKDLGVSTVLGYKKDGRESAEIASMMVVGPEFVDEVLEKFPF